MGGRDIGSGARGAVVKAAVRELNLTSEPETGRWDRHGVKHKQRSGLVVAF